MKPPEKKLILIVLAALCSTVPSALFCFTSFYHLKHPQRGQELFLLGIDSKPNEHCARLHKQHVDRLIDQFNWIHSNIANVPASVHCLFIVDASHREYLDMGIAADDLHYEYEIQALIMHRGLHVFDTEQETFYKPRLINPPGDTIGTLALNNLSKIADVCSNFDRRTITTRPINSISEYTHYELIKEAARPKNDSDKLSVVRFISLLSDAVDQCKGRGIRFDPSTSAHALFSNYVQLMEDFLRIEQTAYADTDPNRGLIDEFFHQLEQQVGASNIYTFLNSAQRKYTTLMSLFYRITYIYNILMWPEIQKWLIPFPGMPASFLNDLKQLGFIIVTYDKACDYIAATESYQQRMGNNTPLFLLRLFSQLTDFLGLTLERCARCRKNQSIDNNLYWCDSCKQFACSACEMARHH